MMVYAFNPIFGEAEAGERFDIVVSRRAANPYQHFPQREVRIMSVEMQFTLVITGDKNRSKWGRVREL